MVLNQKDNGFEPPKSALRAGADRRSAAASHPPQSRRDAWHYAGHRLEAGCGRFRRNHHKLGGQGGSGGGIFSSGGQGGSGGGIFSSGGISSSGINAASRPTASFPGSTQPSYATGPSSPIRTSGAPVIATPIQPNIAASLGTPVVSGPHADKYNPPPNYRLHGSNASHTIIRPGRLNFARTPRRPNRRSAAPGGSTETSPRPACRSPGQSSAGFPAPIPVSGQSRCAAGIAPAASPPSCATQKPPIPPPAPAAATSSLDATGRTPRSNCSQYKVVLAMLAVRRPPA